MKIKIGASLACANQLKLFDDISMLVNSGVDFLHIDIMDGVYVNNYCFGTQIFREIKEHFKNIEIETHLMVIDPYKKIDFFPSDCIDKISFHIESCPNPIQTISKIKSMGMESGIAINAATNEILIDYLYDHFDYILLMAVEAGFSGQDFIDSIFGKTKRIRQELQRRNMDKDIYVDGHIDRNTIKTLYKAGANAFIGGSSGLFKKNSSLKLNITRLKKSIYI